MNAVLRFHNGDSYRTAILCKEGRTKAVKKTDSSWLMLPMFLHNTPKIGRPVTKAKRVMWQKGAFTIPKRKSKPRQYPGKRTVSP